MAGLQNNDKKAWLIPVNKYQQVAGGNLLSYA
jgi:hypothetical protein